MRRCLFCIIGYKDPISGYDIGAYFPGCLINEEVEKIDLKKKKKKKNVHGRSRKSKYVESSSSVMVDT